MAHGAWSMGCCALAHATRMILACGMGCHLKKGFPVILNHSEFDLVIPLLDDPTFAMSMVDLY
jgi:hypothetical protein